jgi:RNA polymerase sigma factor (TIGR02999 family)
LADETTGYLEQAAHGGRGDYDALFARVYDTLRRMAGARLRSERQDHTLSGTALVHEAYLKLIGSDRSRWRSKAQFYAIAALAMRQVLVDYARKKKARRRGGGNLHVTLNEGMATADPGVYEALALEEVLHRLEEKNERQAQVVVCRFFGGMDVREIAEALRISPATVKRDWTVARAWLNRELGREARSDHSSRGSE